MTLIKICGITDPKTATFAIRQGAQYVGLIFHPTSKRVVTSALAKEIADVTLQAGGNPVAVFVDMNAKKMIEICNTIGVSIVQLHGKIAREQQHLLPESWQRIYVCSVTPEGDVVDENIPMDLRPDRDFLLFDGVQAGSGQAFAWQNFTPTGGLLKNFRWFLSGGLSPNNIETALHYLQPQGVDVSSGVEDSTGKKDHTLIANFIRKVRGTYI